LEYKIENDRSISLRYRIDSNSVDRYAGVTLVYDSFGLDFSGYTHLICRLDSVKIDGIHLVFETISRAKDVAPNRFITHDIECLADKQGYRLALSDFDTPVWWYENAGTTPGELGKIYFKQVTEFKIENGAFTKTNAEHSVNIRSIKLHRDRTLLTVVPSLLTILFFLLQRLRNRKSTVVIPYEKIEQASISSDDAGIIVRLLSTEYKKAGLSLNDLSLKTGMPSDRISALLKTTFSCSFRQYLNTIRLTEAQRLLSETDQPISTIALSVGFSNTTHFNRTFKEFAKTTPGEYRNAQKR